MHLKSLFKGGADVPHHKLTAELPSLKMPLPAKIVIPMLQHIGVFCEPKVAKGDQVKVGQVIGDSDKPLSAPIHSSVSGTVTEVASMLYPGGFFVPCVEIAPDGLQTPAEGLTPPKWSNKAEFLQVVRASGLVGLGGAGFPVHVKLNPPADKKIDTLIINAAECEPFISSDYREIMENSWNVISGIKIVMEALGLKDCRVGIEDNKPKAIAELAKMAKAEKGITVHSLPTRYPQGAEKMLIWALTKRAVPSGKLPADVGVIVMNVTTVAELAEYVKTGVPLTHKKITIDGSAVREPKNLEVVIGTLLKDAFEFAGGFKTDPHKVIMGGPMMGVAQPSLETSVIKNTNALLAFDSRDGAVPEAGPCIRCGRCVKACPMSLLPLSLNQAALKNDTASLAALDINSCIECGSCSYVCPAKIQLVQTLRLGKTQLRTAAVLAKAKGAS